MKHINRQQILSRRKQKRIHTQVATEKKHSFHQCVDRELRHVSDQTIDHLIKLARKGKALTNDDKLDIIHVIAVKTGVHLNKHAILERISLFQCPSVKEISINWEKSKKSYFVLKGSLLLYEQKPSQPKEKVYSQTTLKAYKNLYEDEQAQYNSHEQFQKYHSDYILVEDLQHFRGIGPLFKKQSLEVPRRQKLIAINATLVSFEQCERVMEFIFHDGITDEGKLEILYQFPVLQHLGRKIKNFIKSFNVKNYKLNEAIYKAGDIANAVYFLIKGEVKFEFQLQIKSQQSSYRSHRYETPFIMSTQTIGESNYFGQQEILSKSKRNQTAKVSSAKCVVLEFHAQKFEKLMENSDFSSLIIRTAMEKKQQREYKIEKTKQLFDKQNEGKKKYSGVFKQDVLRLPTEPLYISKEGKNVRNHNDSKEKINWMHGHIVKKQASLPVRKSSSKNKPFSMLHVNPDMYEATRKKYRKYSMKTLESSPERKWNEKNVWKVLKLQEILREEDVIVSEPEGRNFYDVSKRLEHHLNETHSIRPKTVSSSYRTKLQYIAYLHRFNH